jgi:hypothetical protein
MLTCACLIARKSALTVSAVSCCLLVLMPLLLLVVVDGDMEDEELNFDLGELDITTQDISLDDVDGKSGQSHACVAERSPSCMCADVCADDLAKFQQDAIVKEALQKGVDLRHYSRQIEYELRKIEGECVQDCESPVSRSFCPCLSLSCSIRVPCSLFSAAIAQLSPKRCLIRLADVKESDELAFLHTQIKHCDTILETMEKMLSRFQVCVVLSIPSASPFRSANCAVAVSQGDLGAISSEIQDLQRKSVTMNFKLNNRVVSPRPSFKLQLDSPLNLCFVLRLPRRGYRPSSSRSMSSPISAGSCDELNGLHSFMLR